MISMLNKVKHGEFVIVGTIRESEPKMLSSTRKNRLSDHHFMKTKTRRIDISKAVLIIA